MITQVFKFVGAESWLYGIELETILLEAGKNLLEDSKMFYPIAFWIIPAQDTPFAIIIWYVAKIIYSL